MHITALPLELLHAIAQDVEHSDLVNLRLVSKSLNSVITPIAFSVVTVTDSVKSAEAVSFLQNSDESVTSVVHEVVFTSRVHIFGAMERAEAASKKAEIDALSLVFSGLNKFCNLKSLRLNFHDMYEEWSTVELQDDSGWKWSHFLHLQIDIFTAIASNSPPPLISLTLVNLIAVPASIYAEERFRRVFQPLQELHISILSNVSLPGAHCHEALGGFWETSAPHMVRSATALTSLTIISDQGVGSRPAMALDDIFLPHLSSLVLHQFVFHPYVVDFVLRHKATLARLELHECSLDGGERSLDGDGLPDLLAPNGGFDGVFPQPWHAVFASFEAELSALRHFAFLPNTYWYSWEDPEFGYDRWDEAAEAVGKGDGPALESLMAVVESRRG